MNIDDRHLDACGRAVQSGRSLPASASLEEAFEAAGVAVETRYSQYDAAGRLVSQRTVTPSGENSTTYRYDAAGNMLRYDVNAGGQNILYDYDYVKAGAGYQVARVTGNRGGGNGVTENTFDVNGYLVGVTDYTDATHNRELWNDTAGRVLLKTQNGRNTRTLIANDEVLGSTELGAGFFFGDLQPVSRGTYNSAPVNYTVREGDTLQSIAEAEWGDATLSYLIAQANSLSGDAALTVGEVITPPPRQPGQSGAYNSAPFTYTVRAGDTLQSIARTVWGDAALWYHIAEANGLSGSAALAAGEVITLPARPTTVHNNVDTYQPYNAADAVGDLTPANLPMPSQDGGCGGFGQIIMIIVIVVVTIYTAGALSAAAANMSGLTFAQTMSVGMTALSGGGTVAGVGITAAGFGVGAASAAVGNIAGQVVGNVIGVQDGFDWKGVALSAVSGGIAAGMGEAMGGRAALNGLDIGERAGVFAARAAVSNALTQGIGVATGLQKSFNWRAVAASAAGAAVGSAMSDALHLSEPTQQELVFGERLARSSLSGLAAGITTAVMRGGRIATTQIATDAFGNALGNSIAASMGSGSAAPDSGAGGLKVTKDRAESWGPSFKLGSDVPEWKGFDYSLVPNGMRVEPQMTIGNRAVVAAADLDDGGQGMTTRYALYRPGADDPYAITTANGGGYQYNANRNQDAGAGLLRRADGLLDRLSRWSKEDVGPAFESAILDAVSSGSDNWGRFLTGLRVVATASSDAVSGTAALGRVFTSSEVRNAFVTRADQFLQDPVGNVTQAFNAWTSKAWYEQLEDVYKVFQGGAAGAGLAGRAKGLFSVGLLDDASMLGPNTQRVLSVYQSAYNDANAAFYRKLSTESIERPANLNFTTWAGGQIDNAARAEMNAFKQVSGMDDLIVNQRLNVPDGIKTYRLPDLFLPGERTVIDGTIGTKGLTSPQIQDFFASGKVDRVILVAPNKNPIIITYEQYMRSK